MTVQDFGLHIMDDPNPAPILGLPAELVQRIMLTSFFSHDKTDSIAVSVKLASIVAFWRTIALNTPELWTYIHTRHREWAKLLAERSGSLMLSIIIGSEASTNTPPEKWDEWMSTLDILTKHSERWRNFTLHRQIILNE